MDAIEKKLVEHYGFRLPELGKPGGIFSPGQKAGDTLWISGQTPMHNGSMLFTGKVGREVTIEDGQKAAQYCLLNILAVIKANLGGFAEVKKFVQLIGFVQSGDDFTQQPQVINGASQMLLNLFGEDRGLPTRMALGANALPGNAAVEIMAVAQLENT